MSGTREFDAVVLAGGRGSRLGGIDKAALRLDGERLVDRVLSAARISGAQRLIAVGPPHVGQLADHVVQEDPPFSGPLAAVEAALEKVQSPWVQLLACDLVNPQSVTALLSEELRLLTSNEDGLLLIDETGHKQWLAGCYRRDALCARIGRLDGTRGRSLASAIGELNLREIRVDRIDTRDIDTQEQLDQARSHFRKEEQ